MTSKVMKIRFLHDPYSRYSNRYAMEVVNVIEWNIIIKLFVKVL